MKYEGGTNCTVGDIAAQTRNALVGGPFGSNLVSGDYVSEGVPVIRGQNMGIGRWVDSEFVFVTPEKADLLSANIARPNDIVFTQRGTLGQVAIVPKGRFKQYLISQSQMKLTVDEKKADPRFIYYYFTTQEMQEYIRSNSIQTGVPHTNLGILRETPLILPPLPEQRAIARILGSLDDKIEANRRMNQTLEALARTLFKSWFVDFDPVRAKAEGREPEGMDAETAALFPDGFEETELGMVPTGWKIGKLGEYLLNFDSKRVPVSGAERSKCKGPYPYHGAAGIMDYIDDYLFDGIYVLIGEDGSVIHENGLAVAQYVWGRFWVNNHAHVLQGKGAISSEQLYLYFQFETVAPYVTGAVQPKLSQGRMNGMPFLFAGDAVCSAFARLVLPFFESLRANVDSNDSLISMRDALLPMLISGELRVKDAENLLSEQSLSNTSDITDRNKEKKELYVT